MGVECDKLLSRAAGRPLVKLCGSTNQMIHGLGVAYSLMSMCDSSA
jgi:hypothetical protein